MNGTFWQVSEPAMAEVEKLIGELRIIGNERQTLIDAQAAELIKLRAQVAALQDTIAQVRKALGGYPESDLLSLATTVATGYQHWCDGNDGVFSELRATIEELQAMLRERNEDVKRKDVQVAELLEWKVAAKDAARGILGYVPDGTDVDADYDKLHELLLQ